MDQSLSIFLHGLDSLPLEYEHDQYILRLVGPSRSSVEASRIRGSQSILFDTDLVDDALEKLIELACDDDDAVNKSVVVEILQIEEFRVLQSLPDNLNQLFPNVRRIDIVNCPQFSSISTTVTQFSDLNHISCDGCTSLTSLKSLSALTQESFLRTISLTRCGLTVTSDDDWAPGMEGLARIGTNLEDYINISITDCESLTRLPQSIVKLKETRRDRVVIYLKRNINLEFLPYVLGDIPQLKTLGIESCPKISQLPWSLSRLDSNASIDLSKMEGLLSNLGMAAAARSFGPFFMLNPQELVPYFSIHRKRFYYGMFRLVVLLARAKRRAIDRLYSPGEVRYEESRERFQQAMSIW